MMSVYPTNRAIRESIKDKKDTLLMKSLTIGEFEKRAFVVRGKMSCDEDKRVLFLKRASDFANFKKLSIPDDYLRFLKASDFILGFFDELSLEDVSIDDLEISDTYAEYGEHLLVLKELKKIYVDILESEGYFDKTTVPKIYEINEKYIKRFKRINLYLDGYLSRFELTLFEKISKICDLFIYYETNDYSKKMMERFGELGFELQGGILYELNLTDKSLKVVEKIKESIDKATITKVDNRITQAAFVKKKVYDFIKSGIKPSNIVVITPDESFVEILNEFDKNNIFNFAAGFSFAKSIIYKRVEAAYLYLEDKRIENCYRAKRLFDNLEALDEFLKTDKIETEKFMDFFVREGDSKDEVEIFKKELYRFGVIKDELKNLKEALYLLLERLKKARLDDNSGGEITVMGILESRLLEFEGVIVVDFNETKVPLKSSKDLFLNSSVRKKASLPTLKDRENLQKNYYYKLFLKAKEVAVCAVENETEKVSRFLDEMKIKTLLNEEFESRELTKILLPKRGDFVRRIDKEIVMDFDFRDFTLSATSFRCFLECRRKFYWRYIKRNEPFEIPSLKSDAKSIGIKLHTALYKLYQNRKSYQKKEELLSNLTRLLLENEQNSVQKFELEMLLKRMEKFAQNEIERFKNGYEVYKKETKLVGEIEGFRVKGDIDRVDKRGEGYTLIDYKSGKINLYNEKNLKSATDFQMEFYYHLGLQQGWQIEEVLFYDLLKGEVVKEAFFEEKMELLKVRLNELKAKSFDFAMSEDKSACRYCPYVVLCGRE